MAQENLEAARELAAELSAGESGAGHQSRRGRQDLRLVSSKEIAAAVKEQMDLDVDKKKIQLKETIRTLGTHMVTVKLHPEVSAELKVVVKEEA